MKENKWKIIITSVLTLLPIVIGLILWKQLPEQIATHWGTSGEPNSWSSKVTAVVGIPLFLTVVQWICIAVTFSDPKNKDQHQKVLGAILWIIPVVSLFVCGSTYAYALGIKVDVSRMSMAFLGILFVALGNYFPKTKQNYSIGIRVPWTLNDEENWNKTHRFASKFWAVGGIIVLFSAFLPRTMLIAITTTVIVVLVLVPILYSYLFYKGKIG